MKRELSSHSVHVAMDETDGKYHLPSVAQASSQLTDFSDRPAIRLK